MPVTRLALRIAFGALALAAALAAGWGAAHLFTSSSQTARAIAWMDSDADDWQRFASRPVANAPPRWNFRTPTEDERHRYALAFKTVDAALGARGEREDFGRFLERTDTLAFLAVKDDALLYEDYFNGGSHDGTVTAFSVSKSFASALVGIAIADGAIGSVEDPVTKYVPELLAKDPRYAEVRLRNLLSMASGIRYQERGTPWSDDTTVYYAPDLRAAAVSSPIVEPPGQRFLYNNYNPLLIGLVLERATKRHVADYLSERLWKPLGMEAPGSWSVDSEASGFEKMESGLNGRAIDFAKFARLYLHRGDWNGRPLVPAAWVDASTRLDTTTDPAPNYQYFWWVNTKVGSAHHFFAAGKHGQYLYVIPEQNLIFVRLGRTDPYRRWVELFEALGARIAAAASG